jgi:DNA-binding beta-propeller fold protein YncE
LKLTDAEALAQIRPTRAEFLASYGKPGGAPGEFNRAEGICMDAQAQLYVADSCNHRVQVFTSDGKFIREFGKPGSAPGELSYPYDVKVDAAGNVFVCEFGNSRIQVFDGAGKPIEIIGSAGGRPGRFNNPWGIALDSHGNLYVADALNHRVQKLVRRGQVAAALDARSREAAGDGGAPVLNRNLNLTLNPFRTGGIKIKSMSKIKTGGTSEARVTRPS